MNRLKTQQSRLFGTLESPTEGCDPACANFDLVDVDGRVRSMVLEVAQSAGWGAVAALWKGIQDDLDIPDPAIAVSGIDGYQVWFSLAEPVSVEQAQDFLSSLSRRYLSDVASRHIRMKPVADATAPRKVLHARMVPALQVETGHWSAFVSPGLASMFADEAWLDVPPNPDAQANLLSNVRSIELADFRRVQDQLRVPNTANVRITGTHVNPNVDGNNPLEMKTVPTQICSDPKRFLLSVMDDSAIELHLRIEAAKALLPYFEGK